MTAPTIVSGATTNFNTTNSLTLAVNTPTYSAGDEIFVAWVTDGDGATATIDSSGWTTLRGPITLSSGAIGVFYLWHKPAGSEPSTYTVTTSVSERSAIGAWAVHDFGGIHVDATDNSGSTSTATVNALTTSVTDTLRISIVASASDRSPVGTMSGHTNVLTVAGTSAGTISVGSKALSATGSDGSFTVTLGASGWLTFAFAIAPSAAAQNVTAGTISASSSVYSPSVHHTLTAGTISSGASLYTPIVTRGAVSVTAAQVGSSSAVYTPTVTATAAIVAGTIATGATVYTPVLSSGGTNVVAGFITGSPTLYAPTVSAVYALAPGFISSGAAVYNPTVSQGALTLAPTFIAAGATMYAPTASVGAVTVTPGLVTGGGSIYDPTVTGGGQSIAPDFIAAGSTIAVPFVLPVPTFIASASAASATSVTNRTPAVPTGTDDGDLMIALVMVELESPGITAPGGWTALWNVPITGRTHSQAVYYRVASSEPADYTWSWTSAEGGVTIVTYRNAALPTLYGNQVNNTQSGSVTAPTLTITANGSVSVWLATIMSGSTFTPPSSYTERVDLRTAVGSTQMGMSIAERFYQVAATTGTVVGTGSNPDYSIGAQIVLAPSSANLSQNVQPPTIAASSVVYAPTTTAAAVTIAAPFIAGSSSVLAPTLAYLLTAGTISSGSSVTSPTITVGAVGLTAAFIGSASSVPVPEVKTRATIGGVLYQDPTNGRYLRTTGGIVVLSGFHTWYTLWDGGAADPPGAFAYTAWLDFVAGHGTNWHRFWAMESARDWDDAVAYFSDHYYARPGPSTAADGKPRFDVTQLNQSYFDRLRARVIQAGNRGHYVTVQLFQGEQLNQRGLSVGTPWAYHPFKSGNNINSISGDANADGDGREVHSASAGAAIITAQRLYVAKVLDTLNDLDNVLYEIGTGDASLATSKQWQWDLVDYCQTYEAGLSKQHPVGMSSISGAAVSDLTGSGADWISHSNSGSTTSPLAADGTYVSLWDTNQVAGLVHEHTWVWKAYLRGNNPQFLDEYDGGGGRYGTDYRSNGVSIRIRNNLGYVLTFGAQIDLAYATPQGALASTGYCLAKTTGTTQMLVYQPASGSFTVDLTSLPGLYSMTWLRTQTGATQATLNISGNGVRTLFPPWASEDAVVYLLKIAEQIIPAVLPGGGGVFAPVVTPSGVSVTAGTIVANSIVRTPTLTVGSVTVAPAAIGSTSAMLAPTVVQGSVAVEVDVIVGSAALYSPTLTVSGATLAIASIASASTVFSPDVIPVGIGISADFIASNSSVYGAIVHRGTVEYDPDSIDSTETHFAPVLTVGAVTVTPATIASVAAIFLPDITPASWSLAFDSIPGGTAVFAPAVAPAPWILVADLIATTASIPAVLITTGAVTVTCNLLANVALLDDVTVTAGEAPLALDFLAATGQVYEPLVSPALWPISAPFIVSASQIYAPAATKGAAHILPALLATGASVKVPVVSTVVAATINFVAGSSQVFSPSIAPRYSVAVAQVASTLALYAPTVVPGTVNVAPDQLALNSSVRAPTVLRGAITLAPAKITGAPQVFGFDAYNVEFFIAADKITAAPQILAPTITVGAATIAPDIVTSTLVVRQPVVTPWTALTYPSHLASVATTYPPIVTVGALTVQAGFIALAPVVRTITVTRGPIAFTAAFITGAAGANPVAVTTRNQIAAPTLAATSQIFAPIVTRGAMTIAPALIAAGSIVATPVVSPWTALTYIDFLGSGNVVFVPIVTLPPYVIAPAVINGGGQVRTPAVAPGAVTMTPAALASGGQVLTVTVEHGLNQYVYANHIAATTQIYTTVVMALLAQRVRRIGHEVRVMTIPLDPLGRRVFAVE